MIKNGRLFNVTYSNFLGIVLIICSAFVLLLTTDFTISSDGAVRLHGLSLLLESHTYPKIKY